jgi:hypothetical protein
VDRDIATVEARMWKGMPRQFMSDQHATYFTELRPSAGRREELIIAASTHAAAPPWDRRTPLARRE